MNLLPFLRKKTEASISANPDTLVRREDEEEGPASLHVAADEVLKAIEAKDAFALTEALKAFCDIRDSEPHEEGSHNG